MPTTHTAHGMAALLLAIATSGCALSPNLDRTFGQAVKNAQRAQTMNPDTTESSLPPSPLDGKAASGAIDRYHRSFVQPPAAVLGGVGAGGTGFIPR